MDKLQDEQAPARNTREVPTRKVEQITRSTTTDYALTDYQPNPQMPSLVGEEGVPKLYVTCVYHKWYLRTQSALSTHGNSDLD